MLITTFIIFLIILGQEEIIRDQETTLNNLAVLIDINNETLPKNDIQEIHEQTKKAKEQDNDTSKKIKRKIM